MRKITADELHQDTADLVGRNPLLELIKVIYLVSGTFLLWTMVVILWAFGKVPGTAADGGYIALMSVIVAGLFGIPWQQVFRELMDRAGDQAIAVQALTYLRPAAQRIQRIFPNALSGWFDRGSLGLWIPFLINLVSVGWLVYFSGGIARSPFSSVPVIMFTLVVLLIDPPIRPSPSGAGAAPEAASLDITTRKSIASRPFLVLSFVAVFFYTAIILISERWPYMVTVITQEQREQIPVPVDHLATVIQVLAAAFVGISLAAIARVSIVRAKASGKDR